MTRDPNPRGKPNGLPVTGRAGPSPFSPGEEASPTIVSQEMSMLSKREFLRRAATIGMGGASAHALAASDRPTAARDASEPFFRTRGAVLGWSRTWKPTTGPPWRKRRA